MGIMLARGDSCDLKEKRTWTSRRLGELLAAVAVGENERGDANHGEKGERVDALGQASDVCRVDADLVGHDGDHQREEYQGGDQITFEDWAASFPEGGGEANRRRGPGDEDRGGPGAPGPGQG